MCGIAGFSRDPRDKFNANKLAKALLLGIEHRGRDATGAAWFDRRGDLVSHKHPVSASAFVGHLSIDKRAKQAILHTRMATQGTPKSNLNNHPIYAGSIVGVHNGMVSNDYELIRNLNNYKRAGQVDSEAIFAVINAVKTGEVKDVGTALELPEADMALAWLDRTDDDDVMHLARGEGRPLIIGQSKNGTLIFASEKEVVVKAAAKVGLDLCYLDSMKEGEYFKVRRGRIVETQAFIPSPMYSRYYTKSYNEYKRTSTTSSKGTTTYTNTTRALLDMKYLDVDVPVPEMNSETVRTAYKRRDAAIGDWVEDRTHDPVTGEPRLDHELFNLAAKEGAFLKPGTWVTTWFSGEVCDAQVYRLPNSFPDGDYILKVLVPVYDLDDKYLGYEAIFLARTVDWMDGDAFYLTGNGSADDDEEKDDTVAELELVTF